MKSLAILALVGLLVTYVCGRAMLVHPNHDYCVDNHFYEGCMLCCDDAFKKCLDDAGDHVRKRQACRNEAKKCTGESSDDEDIPPHKSYKRVVKRSCQSLMDTNNFVMQQ